MISPEVVGSNSLYQKSVTFNSTQMKHTLIKNMYLEMEGRQSNCVVAYSLYGIRVVVENIGLVSAGAFVVDMNGTRQEVKDGLAPGQHINYTLQVPRRVGGMRRLPIQ